MSMAAPIPLPTTSARQTPIFFEEKRSHRSSRRSQLARFARRKRFARLEFAGWFGQQIGLYFKGGLQLRLVVLHSLEALVDVFRSCSFSASRRLRWIEGRRFR